MSAKRVPNLETTMAAVRVKPMTYGEARAAERWS
jgi:hypothetical protein